MNQQDQSIEKFTKSVVAVMTMGMMFILWSAATATDPFFRKRMGERYFTYFRALLSAAGWVGVYWATTRHKEFFYGRTPPGILVAGGGVILAYAIAAIWHLNDIHQRRCAGDYWHSRSRGESILGTEDPWRDFFIEVVISVALWFISPLFSGFFALSRILGYAAEAAARAAFYNRYLDIQDAKIEAHHMEVALRDGLAPSYTAGFVAPLSKKFATAHRANIARVIAAQYRAEAPVESPPPSVQPAAPAPAQPPRQPITVADVQRISRQGFAAFWTIVLRFRRPLSVALVILALAAGIKFSMPYIKQFWGPTKSPGTNQSAAVTLPPCTTTPTDAAPATSQSGQPASDLGSVATKAAVAEAKAKAEAALAAQRAAEERAAQAEAALAAQKAKEEREAQARAALEAKQRARTQDLEKISSLLPAQLKRHGEFKTNCMAQLSQNAKKIENLNRSAGDLLLQRNDRIFEDARSLSQTQALFLVRAQQGFTALNVNSQSDPAPLLKEMGDWIASAEPERKKIEDELTQLTLEITNAPQKKGFLFFK